MSKRQITKNLKKMCKVAIGVASSNLKPDLPSYCPQNFSKILMECFEVNPESRPNCQQILDCLNWKKNKFVNETKQSNYESPIFCK